MFSSGPYSGHTNFPGISWIPKEWNLLWPGGPVGNTCHMPGGTPRMEIPSGTTSSTINRENSTPKVKDEFSFTRLIVEDMLFHWNLLQGCTHQSLWLESPKAQCSTFQSWDWWCTKGKVKVNRFLVFWAVNLFLSCTPLGDFLGKSFANISQISGSAWRTN